MATIVVSAAKVISAAENTIAEIKETRKSDNERMIQHAITKSVESKLRKFFFLKPMNREQAINMLMQDSWGFYPSIRGFGDLEHAEKLLRLARNGDPVTLNEEDCRVLF